MIIEARENKGFVYTKEVWGYFTLTIEINAGGYLYLSWYSKGNLGMSVWLLTSKRITQRRKASSTRRFQGVIDWLVSAVSEIRCD